MQVQTQQSLAVVYDHTASLKEHWPRENDRSLVYGMNGCSDGCGVIKSLVSALDLLVEDPLRAEDARDGCIYRRLKLSGPQLLLSNRGKGLLFDLFVGGDGSQLLGTRFGVLLGHLNWNSGINRPRNFDFSLNINRFAGADNLREAQLVIG